MKILAFISSISCVVFLLIRAEEFSSTEANDSAVVDAFENSVSGMENNIKSFMNNIMKEMLPHAIRIGLHSEASLTCLFDLTKTFKSVQKLEAWAVRMMDATGKPSGGLMEGTSTALGDYDECLDVRSPSGYPVIGEYCLLEIKPPGSIVDAMKDYQVNKERTNHSIANTKSFIGFLQKVRTNPDHVIFRLGICVPASCSEEGIQSLLDLAFEDFDVPIKVAHCDYKYEFALEPYEIVIISFLVLLIVLVVFGTVVSVVNSDNNISSDSSTDKPENSSTESTKIRHQVFHRCMDAFSKLSLCHNTKKLFNCDSEGDASDVIKGMKVLTIVFAIFAHTYALPHPLHLYRFRNTLNFTKFIDEVLFGAIANSSVGADTFFFLAGFHFIYNRWRLSKRTNILSYILKFISVMYIRIIAIQILVGCFLFLMPTFGSGPLWEEFVEGPIDNCKETWWMNLLFIQNFLGPYDICLYPTWILATIMQIFLITAVIVYMMHRWPTYGILTTLFTLILAMIGIAVVTGVAGYPATLTIYFYDYSDNNQPKIFVDDWSAKTWHRVLLFLVKKEKSKFYSKNTSFSDNKNITKRLPTPPSIRKRTSIYFWKHLYTQFYAHIGPQCIGMMLAYFIADYPVRKVDKRIAVPLWIICLVTLSSIIFGLHSYRDGQKMHRGLAIFYAAVHRQAWAIALAWMIYACCAGQGGMINSLFTWKGFIPMERLCYLAYMLHIPLMYYQGGVQRERMFMGHYNQIMCFLSYATLSFALASVCYLFFQVPYEVLEGLIFNKHNGNIWGANSVNVSQTTLESIDEEKATNEDETKSNKSKVLYSRNEEIERF